MTSEELARTTRPERTKTLGSETLDSETLAQNPRLAQRARTERILSEVAPILDGKTEAELTRDDDAALRKACADLRELLKDDLTRTFCAFSSEEIRHLIPSDDRWTNVFCNARLAIALGIVPEEIIPSVLDFIQRRNAFLKHQDYSQPRPTYQSFQEQELNFADFAGTLQANSPLEWIGLFPNDPSKLSPASSALDFLKSLSSLVTLSQDDAARHAFAAKSFQQIYDSIQMYSELGRFVPVEVQDPLHTDLSALPSPNALYFGHHFQVYFHAGSKNWFIFCYSGDISPEQKKQGRKEQGVFAVSFTHFRDLKKECDRIITDKVCPVLQVRPDGRFTTERPPVYFGNGNSHHFIGERIESPLILAKIRESEISEVSLGASWEAPAACIKLQDGTSIFLPVWGDTVPQKFVYQFTEANNKKAINVRILTFSDATELVLLQSPAKVSDAIGLIAEPAAVTAPSRPFTIHGFQRFTDGATYFPLLRAPKIDHSRPRFKKEPLILTYDTAGALTPGVPINRLPMTKVYDPNLQKIGFAPNSEGHNCLSNCWDISIPLQKPTEGQFSHSVLAPCSPLASIPEPLWSTYLRTLEGDYINQIGDVPTIAHRATSERLLGSDDQTGSTRDNCSLGVSYKKPRFKVDLFGAWQVSHCKIENQEYYVVDSPLYGNALYLFRHYDSATAAARHFESAGKRLEVQAYQGFVARILHTKHWRDNLTDTIYQHIIREPRPKDALLG